MSIDNSNSNYNTKDINDKDDDYEVFKMSEVKPLNNPDCHHFFVKDLDEIDGYQAWTCRHCRRGKFFPKGYTIINS
jgi:hypothetical protein